MDDLIQKLMVSKQIMDRHNQMPRGNNGALPTNINLESFEAPQANYNLPQEFVQEQTTTQAPTQTMSRDRILNSKLPDEIKQLMIENPIVQPSMGSGPTLSNELVDKASRLMKTDASGKVNESIKRQPQRQTITENTDIKQMVKEAVREILSESGLLVESTSKSNETFTFRVGSHIFEGKVSKIKKIK
jgi:hypothetical protein